VSGPRLTLTVRLSLLSLTVGAVAAAASALAGAGMCAVPAFDPAMPSGPPDGVCLSLVRTLALRVGLLSAGATAIVVLMMVGLSRLVVGPEGPAGLESERSESLGLD
jgi:hypothetical protein